MTLGDKCRLLRTIDDIVNHTVQSMLDLFDIHLDITERWSGVMGLAADIGRRRAATLQVVPGRVRGKRR